MTILLTGCASIVSKTSYPVTVSSNPSGATLTIVNKKGKTVFSGTTPTVVTLKAGAGFFTPGKYTMTMEKAGYPTKTATLRASLDGWYVGNIIFGGLIGILIVDPATGAMWRLDDSIEVSLGAGATLHSQERQLKIVDINTIPEEWKGKLVKLD